MSLHHLQLNTMNGTGTHHQVFLDGKAIHCSGIDIHVAVGEVPWASIEVPALSDVNELVDVDILYHPATVEEAHAIIRGAVATDRELREAWIASIRTGIEETIDAAADRGGGHISSKAIAENVLDLLMGDLELILPETSGEAEDEGASDNASSDGDSTSGYSDLRDPLDGPERW